MRVGISVLTRQGQSLWENGIGQNALALAMLMQELPNVRSVVLVDVGEMAGLPHEAQVLGCSSPSCGRARPPTTSM